VVRYYVTRLTHGTTVDRLEEQAETRRLDMRVSVIGSDDALGHAFN
jgi:hypothetical protein